ncbi:MAG: hypothetical protein CVU73_03310 [Deltaproteobacteria bacterium HGW-Deltaproteobacteria-8]|jgi:hypothetical protein|nr:MAG: hypothetical protein CVU73_03310 [Deltaproteobacteria bacterium HGW-Deltaproteobacteria-8]
MNLCTTYLDVKIPEISENWIGAEFAEALALRDFTDPFTGLRIYLKAIPEGLLPYQTPKHRDTSKGFAMLQLCGLNALGAFLTPFIEQSDGQGGFEPIVQEAFFLPVSNILGYQAMDADNMDVLFGPKPSRTTSEDETPICFD